MALPGADAVALAYHERTKHHPGRYARALGYMDWDTQPDPFRRFEGAEVIPLEEVRPTQEPSFDQVLRAASLEPRPLDRSSISQLLFDSLALSAWKELGDARWSLRVNPSSGNLHPTEGYLISGPVDGVVERPAVCHYAPFLHALERRAELTAREWEAVREGLPAHCFFVGLSSIHWRESWKYGERAFRYCQHDAGHAIAAVAIAAAALGWEARLLESVTDEQLAVLLGTHVQSGIEAEHADCLIALYPGGQVCREREWRPPQSLLARLSDADWTGTPAPLSERHHDWPVIKQVAAATAKTRRPDKRFWQLATRPPPVDALPSRSAPARALIRQRRSAVAMDGVTAISLPTFYRTLASVAPSRGAVPFDTLPWTPRIHLALFVHRVEELPPGLYLMVRHPPIRDRLRAAMRPALLWERVEGCPDGMTLELLARADERSAARFVSCNQDIAADGAFALGMIADFEEPIRRDGAWFYRRLHWEAGLLGQVLYLEAEAARVRATGIGCFFDDVMHELLGLEGPAFQTLYHFTVGAPVGDPRLRIAS